MKRLQVQVQHIYREGNQLADILANTAFSNSGKHVFHSFKDLPTTARRIVNSDKSQTPYIRIRTKQVKHAIL